MLKKIYPVLLLTFVNTLGFSILIPILPFIVREGGYPDYVYGFLISAYSSSQFFGSLVLGSLSDLRGRKPILVISQAGTLLSWFIFAGAWVAGEHYGWITLSIFIIVFARIADGITGGNTTVANAYLSDILPPEERGAAFGFVGAVLGLGMIIGPAIGAITSVSEIGYLGMVLFSIALSTITLAAIAFMLPESLDHEHRLENHEEHKHLSKSEQVNFIKNKMRQDLNIFNSLKIFKSNKTIMSTFLVKLFMSIVMASYSSTIMLLLIDRFSFTQKEAGFFLLAVGGFLMFNQIFLVKKFIKKFGEYLTLFMGMLFIGVGLFVFPSLDNLVLFICFYYITNLGLSLAFPTIRAIISREASKKLQGKVMGVDESIFSISMAVMPFTAAAIYDIIGWKSFMIWASISIIGALYYLMRNIDRIDLNSFKNADSS